MHISGVLDCTLMAISQWLLLVFMVYIKQNISSSRAGVSVRMIHKPWFQYLWSSYCLTSPPGPRSSHLPIPNPVTGVYVHAPMYRNSPYRQTVRWSDGLPTIPDNPNTPTSQSFGTNDAPQDPIFWPVTWNPTRYMESWLYTTRI